MKKLLAIAMILSLAFMYQMGRKEGIRHAMEDSTIWTVELYDPDNPDENTRPDGTDQTIYIDLDGEIWEHGMYQG